MMLKKAAIFVIGLTIGATAVIVTSEAFAWGSLFGGGI